jgi:hypothetical protein
VIKTANVPPVCATEAHHGQMGTTDPVTSRATQYRASVVLVSSPLWLAAVLVAPALAAADPPLPQPNSGCTQHEEGAVTPSGSEDVLVCTNLGPLGYRWMPPASATVRPFTRYVTVQQSSGLVGTDIAPGAWVGEPQDSASLCTETQEATGRTGRMGVVESQTGSPGQPLAFRVERTTWMVNWTGNCLWTNVGP